MVLYREGSPFYQNAEIVLNQVNCKGLMGKGFQKEVKQNISEDDFQTYRNYCKTKGSENLGAVFYCHALRPSWLIIANCFGQIKTGKERIRYTDYKALKTCILSVKEYCKERNITKICVPERMGCGPDGGDWNIILNNIIIPALDAPETTLIIAKL